MVGLHDHTFGTAGGRQLLRKDLQHERELEGTTIVNPFRLDPYSNCSE
jgi:predicted nucleic acid-binding protein